MKTSITIPILRTAASLFLMLICSVTAWAEDPKPISEATAEDIGKVISTDGNIYPTQNDMQSGYAVAMIAYVDEQNHTGLAIALDNVYYFDENQQYKGQFQWAETTKAVTTWATDKAITGGTWKVPTIQEWQQMLIGCGSEGEVSDDPSSNTFTFTGIIDKLTAIDSKLQNSYWSATETSWDTGSALTTYFDDSNENTYVSFHGSKKVSPYGNPIRACLSFTTSSGGGGDDTNYTINAGTESINMPVSGTDIHTIAPGVTSFKIYDDGGSDSYYSDNCNGYIQLTAPEGCTIQLTGSLNTESNYDKLTVWDGIDPTDDNAKLLDGVSGSINYDEAPITSTGNTMLLYFHSDSGVNKAGLDLTVTIIGGQGGQGSDANTIDSNTESINMPVTGTDEYSIEEGVTSFKIYDDGGQDNNYSDDCDGYIQLTAPEGYIMHLTGTVTSEYYTDMLTVWDGTDSNDDNAKLLDNISDSYGTNINTASTGNTMLLRFSSNNSTNYAGLDLTVNVLPYKEFDITLNSATGGSIACYVSGTSAEKASLSQDVSVYITPAQGYMINRITVKDADDNEIKVNGGRWYSDSYDRTWASFTMPYSDVTITPEFTELSNLSNLYINMDADNNIYATIPKGISTFKIYDNGGANGPYKEGGTVSLTAPENYILELTGSIAALTYEKLTVYDAQYASTYYGPELLNKGSDSNGQQTDIGSVRSTGKYLAIRFNAYENWNGYSGLDLTVRLINNSAENDITIQAAEGGSVTATVDNTAATKARVNDIVTLTATPAEGYVLSSISVTDGNSGAVVVTGGTWYNNTATFTMPASAATITPVFTSNLSNLSIDIPKNSTLSATIPECVTSFSVYDDGGPNGEYSSYSDGNLVLTAATGKLLLLTGSIMTNSGAHLSAWDGTDATNDKAKLLDKKYSSSPGVATSIGSYCSTSQSMTLNFHTEMNLGPWAGLSLTVTQVDLNLSDRADNNAAITAKDRATEQTVALTGRTLYKDGKWNTLCLPFNLVIEGSPLNAAEAHPLTAASVTGTTLELTFGPAVTTLQAGTPYIIKWTKASNYKDDDAHNIVSPVFNGVTVSDATNDFVNNVSGDGRVRFIGSYATMSFTGTDNGILLMGGGNKLYYPASGSGLGAQRAYFKVGEDGTQQARSITGFNISFDNNDITGISGVIGNSGASNGLRPMDKDQWYDLNGRRLSGIPSGKGVYLNNGRKVVIK